MMTFANWVGNQTCTPARRLSPPSEAAVQAAVRAAAAVGQGVRVVATGHSFSPVHLTDGTLIDLAELHGITDVDAAGRRVRALPGTPVGAFGAPLWDAGLALANEGDIDTQGISGAIGTATHGSGIRLQSFSATLRAAASSRAPAMWWRSTQRPPICSPPPRWRSGCSAS